MCSSRPRTFTRALVLGVFALALSACSDDAQSPAADAAVKLDGAAQEGGVNPDGPPVDVGVPAKLPAVPQQSGVVYVAHYHTTDLRVYRIDGTDPSQVHKIDLGTGKESHDMALDPYNDLLYVVSDGGKQVTIFKLFRPTGPGQPVKAPEKRGTISTTLVPLFARVDPQHHRLYVVAAPVGGGLVTKYKLLAYDVSDPTQPKAISGSPFTIPVTVSLALDGPRQALFLVESKANKLHAFDLRGDKLKPLTGTLDLKALFPQQNQTSFAARELSVDPFRNRLYAARVQGGLSELIVFEYPAALPTASAGYSQLAKVTDLKVLADPFDVDKPLDQRPNLLGSYVPTVDLQRGHVFMSAAAYMGTGLGAIMVGITSGLKLAKGCDAFEGFGCWYKSYFGGKAGAHQRTDGATCVDYTHKVVVGTSIDAMDETQPGAIHLFRYTPADLSTSVWTPAKGSNLTAGGLPVAAACH
jgi:6-phosphogluconolactonase (cycloisomerase 2 family)